MQTNTHTRTGNDDARDPVGPSEEEEHRARVEVFFRFGGFALANEWSANCSEMMLRLSMANPITGMIGPSPRHLRVTGV